MSKNNKKSSYSVAVLTTNGGSRSTQLWDQEPDAPFRVIADWATQDEKNLTRESPAVIYSHDGQKTTYVTVGEAIDVVKELGPVKLGKP